MFRLKFDRFSQATKKSQTSTRKPGMNQKNKKKNIITPPIPGIRINEELKNGLLDLSATAKDLILKK